MPRDCDRYMIRRKNGPRFGAEGGKLFDFSKNGR